MSTIGVAPADRPETAEVPLEATLDNRRWVRRTRPFPHFVVTDVFTADIYKRLEAAFRLSLERVLGYAYLEKHDIHGTTLLPADADAFYPLLSRGWHDLLANVLGVVGTGHVMCGMHHHTIGSADGFPHNDLNAGWFAGEPQSGSVELSSPYAVEYTNGNALRSGVQPRETIRAVAIVYYLANDVWLPGDGGETGLYRTATDPVHQPVTRVPPINNSLLAFECTPRSYHGFIGNTRTTRNSIVMWLHRSKGEVTARWGDAAIMPYGLRPVSRPSKRRS